MIFSVTLPLFTPNCIIVFLWYSTADPMGMSQMSRESQARMKHHNAQHHHHHQQQQQQHIQQQQLKANSKDINLGNIKL